MIIFYRMAGALLLAYFTSRVALRLPFLRRGFTGLLSAHGFALLAELVLLAAIRLPLGIFSMRQTLFLIVAHVAWIQVDAFRRNYPRSNDPAEEV